MFKEDQSFDEASEQKPQKSRASKFRWTLIILIVYLALMKFRLYGVPREGGSDPIFIFRIITASQRGSFAEFGIIPIALAIIMLQFIVGLGILKLDLSKTRGKKVYSILVKVISVILTILFAIFHITSGIYGEDLLLTIRVSIFFQLIFGGLFIIFMDEIIRRGYGLGNGISLFIIASVSYNIFDGMFGLTQDSYAGFDWYRGCILSFFLGISRGNVAVPFNRPGRTPDFLSFLLLIIVMAIIIYLISIKVEIPVLNKKTERHTRYSLRYLNSFYPPILFSILSSSVIYSISNIVFNNWRNETTGFKHFMVRLFGSWETIPGTRQVYLISGLAALTTPPLGPEFITIHPGYIISFILYMTIMTGFFSISWMKTLSVDPIGIGKKILREDKMIPGFREDPRKIGKYLDPFGITFAIIGGLFVGFLAGFFEFVGPLGTGIGLLITASILREYYDILVKKK